MAEDLLNGKTGDVRVVAKFARRDTEAGSAPDWSEPREVTLSVERRTVSLPTKRNRPLQPGDHAGDILTLNVRDFDWAEYGEIDRGEGEFINQFLCEEYRMEVLHLIADSGGAQ